MNWNAVTLREAENASIEDFIEKHIGKLGGRVLDYGCGRQPYRRFVQRAGGDYVPYDRVAYPACVAHTSTGPDTPLNQYYDAILCTQVIQYVPGPHALVEAFRLALNPGGWLILTGPTNWPEVEKEDLWRFTCRGAERLLDAAGYDEFEVERRSTMSLNDIHLSLGYAAVARR